MKKMKNHAKYFSLLYLYFLLVSCNTTEPKISDIISLTALDASCKEAWLELKTQNLTFPAEVTLAKNEKIVKTISLQSADTVIYDEGLLPSNTYKYQASIPSAISQSNNQSILSSDIVSVTTMDTTSHNFTWQTYTFGDGSGGSSYLKDVAIVNENDIWAVGEIYENGEKYNAVHWDGSMWKLKQIEYYGACSNVKYPVLYSIISFAENDMIITQGGSIGFFDGKKVTLDCGVNPLLTGKINAMWGVSSSDFYVVGNNGNIAHYNGSEWRKIESGTDIDLTDIYGTAVGEIIWTCGWNYNNGNTVILEIQNNATKIIYYKTKSYIYGVYNSLWTEGTEYILAGSKLKRFSLLEKNMIRLYWLPTERKDVCMEFRPNRFVYSTRGTGKNNIFLGGDSGMLWHYNGKSWFKYNALYNNKYSRRIYGISVKDNICVAVGDQGASIMIIMGRK